MYVHLKTLASPDLSRQVLISDKTRFPIRTSGSGFRSQLPPRPGTTEVPTVDTATREHVEDFYQVTLYNDNQNAMEHVIKCLMQVFGHSSELAGKIMLEAHMRGRAIAEVEAETQARLHRDQLQSFGLTASIEKI